MAMTTELARRMLHHCIYSTRIPMMKGSGYTAEYEAHMEETGPSMRFHRVLPRSQVPRAQWGRAPVLMSERLYLLVFAVSVSTEPVTTEYVPTESVMEYIQKLGFIILACLF